MKTRAPFGTWPSPFSADRVARAANRPGDLVVDGLDLYVSEARPAESGRAAIVKLPRAGAGATEEALAEPFSARSRVHEYGGGAFTVRSEHLVFVNDTDQALYVQGPSERPRRVSPLLGGGQRRFAEPLVDLNRERVLAVVEEHRPDALEPQNFVAALGYGSRTGRFEVLQEGQDFYASLRLSPDGSRLAWLSWSHPQMPWTGSELWVADLDGRGFPGARRRVAGGSAESIFQPEWDAEGGLTFISDRSGYWNLYRWQARSVTPLCPRDADFGVPQWAFGLSTYCRLPGGDLLCTFTEKGSWRLARLSRSSSELCALELPYTEYASLRSTPDGAALLVASPTEPTTLVHFDAESEALARLRQFGNPAALGSETTSAEKPSAAHVSVPTPIEYASAGGARAHALFYPPTHPDYEGLPNERPPLLVRCHGGPTAQATTGLNLRIQYWTSRGFALLDVNYRGSSGYGRAYRDSLRGHWGIAEVEDCLAGARHLAERGLIDRRRMCISGGSAGGYTSLCALTFHDDFAAGAIYYGVSDLGALVRDTHKFESRYLDGLIGPYPAESSRYAERSPLSQLDRLRRPVAFFHGLQDKVTPPNQATLIAKALEQKGVPVAFIAFPDEGHGFRHADTIRRTLEAEYYFYCRIFDLKPEVMPEPIEIKNLPDTPRR